MQLRTCIRLVSVGREKKTIRFDWFFSYFTLIQTGDETRNNWEWNELLFFSFVILQTLIMYLIFIIVWNLTWKEKKRKKRSKVFVLKKGKISKICHIGKVLVIIVGDVYWFAVVISLLFDIHIIGCKGMVKTD